MKEIEVIPQKKICQQIVRRIQNLTENPRPTDSKSFPAAIDIVMRQGVYRIVYAVENAQLVVYIVKVVHRKDVYRRRH